MQSSRGPKRWKGHLVGNFTLYKISMVHFVHLFLSNARKCTRVLLGQYVYFDVIQYLLNVRVHQTTSGSRRTFDIRVRKFSIKISFTRGSVSYSFRARTIWRPFCWQWTVEAGHLGTTCLDKSDMVGHFLLSPTKGNVAVNGQRSQWGERGKTKKEFLLKSHRKNIRGKFYTEAIHDFCLQVKPVEQVLVAFLSTDRHNLRIMKYLTFNGSCTAHDLVRFEICFRWNRYTDV